MNHEIIQQPVFHGKYVFFRALNRLMNVINAFWGPGCRSKKHRILDGAQFTTQVVKSFMYENPLSF